MFFDLRMYCPESRYHHRSREQVRRAQRRSPSQGFGPINGDPPRWASCAAPSGRLICQTLLVFLQSWRFTSTQLLPAVPRRPRSQKTARRRNELTYYGFFVGIYGPEVGGPGVKYQFPVGPHVFSRIVHQNEAVCGLEFPWSFHSSLFQRTSWLTAAACRPARCLTMRGSIIRRTLPRTPC